MSELSHAAELLLQISGTLYGLLLAYYAFSLGRFFEASGENQRRLDNLRSHGGPICSVEDLLSFAQGAVHQYVNRRRLAQAIWGSSVLFLGVVVVLAVQLAGPVGPITQEMGNLVIEYGSFVLLVVVILLFVYATWNEWRSSTRQVSESHDIFSRAAEDIWPQEPDRVTEFRSKWDRGH